ncbi:glycosyltransferase family 2 protein [Salinicola halophyticus]|uniref:glycosyltransferase family 2 protein n=1 Tax=Salinicola halophyticus TaxID=1808881 RepID=UPI003F44D78C
MDTSPRVSLVIPLHDSVRFFERLLPALNAQTDQNFEAIFVDDRSTDDPESALASFDIQFRYRYARLGSERHGPGAARNMGVAMSRAKWVGFVDSDDVIHATYVASLTNEAKRSGADIVETLYLGVNEAMQPISAPDLKAYLSAQNRFVALLSGEMGRTSWAKLYDREFIERHGITFPEAIENGEDHIFLLNAYACADTVSTVFENLYYWVRRGDSLTGREATTKTVDDFFEVSRRKRELVEARAEPELFELFATRLFKEGRVLAREIKQNTRWGKRKLIESFLEQLSQPEWQSLCAFIAQHHSQYYQDLIIANREYLDFFDGGATGASPSPLAQSRPPTPPGRQNTASLSPP